MKQRQDPQSPWGIRLYFEDSEFEAMMDDLRRKAGQGCFTPGEGVDVDLVLLRALEIEADYVWMPEGTIGRTIFSKDGRAEIQVSRELSDEAEADSLARRRLRTTLAHEVGHVACHPQLFLGDTSTLSLFDPDESIADKPPIMCRAESVGQFRYAGDWWEFQANQCMAALLMPQKLFQAQVEALLEVKEVATFEQAILNDRANAIVRDLSGHFDVSKQAVFFRLKKLGHVPDDQQAALEFDD